MLSRTAGLSALADGHLDLARAELEAAVAKVPSDARAWRGLAEVYRRLERWDRALEALDHVALSTRGTADAITAWILKAELLDRQLDQPQGAQRAWEKVLQLDDRTALAWLNLSELCLRRKKWQAAVANADHGLQFGTHDQKIRAWLLLCRAVGQNRANESVGPTSTFFNQLGRGADGSDALAQALAEWSRLGELVGDDPLADAVATSARIREHRPLATPPTWWGH